MAFAAVIVVAGVVFLVACNKENADKVATDPATNLQTKKAYPPDPSWAHTSADVAILRSNSKEFWNCSIQPEGYFCGFALEQSLTDGPTNLFFTPGMPLGLSIKKSFLLNKNLVSVVDSAKNGHLTFHADINVASSSLQAQLGFSQIPAGRYPATELGDSAVYVQFSSVQ